METTEHEIGRKFFSLDAFELPEEDVKQAFEEAANEFSANDQQVIGMMSFVTK